jgi:hypothetical protein
VDKEPTEEIPATANKKETNKPHTPGKDKAELTDEQPFTNADDQKTHVTNAEEGVKPAAITGETQKELTDEQPFTNAEDQKTPATNAEKGAKPAAITGETQKDPNPK